MRYFVSKFIRFDGRATRLEYWVLTLLPFVWTIGVLLISEAFAHLPIIAPAKAGLWFLSTVIGIFTITGFITVAGRRAHDRAKSAWLIIVLYLIPMWAFIELGFFRGTQGPNAYGPDPLDGGNSVPAASMAPIASDR